MSESTSPSPPHRSSTPADAATTVRPRRLPGLPTQAAIVALVPAFLWAVTHPALVSTAVVTAAVTAGAVTLVHQRRARHATSLAE